MNVVQIPDGTKDGILILRDSENVITVLQVHGKSGDTKVAMMIFGAFVTVFLEMEKTFKKLRKKGYNGPGTDNVRKAIQANSLEECRDVFTVLAGLDGEE